MKLTRRRFLHTSAAGGAFLAGSMPHIWSKNSDLAWYHRDHRGIAEQGDNLGD
jgi:glycerol kinase